MMFTRQLRISHLFHRGLGVALILTVFSILNTGVYAGTIIVGPGDGPKAVASGLQSASAGDTVLITAGVYSETDLIIDKSIIVIGEGKAIIDGRNDGTIITITAPDVTVSGLDIRGAGVSYIKDNAGVKIREAHGCRIIGNILRDNFFGIYLDKTAVCEIADNQIFGLSTNQMSSGNGIHLWYCREISIHGNYVTGHRDGIYLEFVAASEISDNHCERNLRYGLHFMYSDSCLYQKNKFIANESGVAVMYTRNVKMIGNNFEQSWGGAAYGLLLKDISDSEVSGNRFADNSVGVFIEGSNRVRFADNDFVSNGWAVRIMASAIDNVFTGNNFIDNSFQVATNGRHNFSRFHENYWSAYRGYDLDRDGYGDVPFRPVKLFSVEIQSNPMALVLLHSLFIELLNLAEDVIPTMTPESLADARPVMRPLP